MKFMNKQKLYQSNGKGALIKLDYLKEAKSSFGHHRRNQLSLNILPKQESANQYFGERNIQSDWELKTRSINKINSEEKLNNSMKMSSVDDYKSGSKVKLANQSYNDIKRSCFKRTRSNARSLCDKGSLIPVVKNLSFDLNWNPASRIIKNQDLVELNEISNWEPNENHRPSGDFTKNQTKTNALSGECGNKSLELSKRKLDPLGRSQDRWRKNMINLKKPLEPKQSK